MVENAPGEQLVEIDLFDWTGGIKNKRRNPLVTQGNSFEDGEDLDLVDGCLRTQRGAESLAADIWDYEVRALFQVRFPTHSKMYLIAQVVGTLHNPGE